MESKIMHSKKSFPADLTPWDDRDQFNDILLLQDKQNNFNIKHSYTQNICYFPSISNSYPSTSFKHKFSSSSIYDKNRVNKVNKSNTIYSQNRDRNRKSSPPNNKILFPIKTNTVHIQNVKEVETEKNKNLIKNNIFYDEILTICNNSLIKVKVMKKKRNSNESNPNGVEKGKGYQKVKDKQLDRSVVVENSSSKYKKSSLLKIKSLLMG